MALSIVLIFFILLFLMILVRGIIENKRKIETWEKDFKENYGKENKRHWKSDQLELISHYSKRKERKSYIDDLTWNDLDMDAVFYQMAYTGSSLGDDYLYDVLRNPVKEEEILLNREKKISVFMKQEEVRIKLQIVYAKIGRVGAYSYADYLEYLMKEEPKGNGKHYVTDGLICLSLLLMGYQISFGWVAFFGLIFYNIMMYFKDKAYFEPYLTSLRYLLTNLEYAKELAEILPKEWKEEKEKLRSILNSMKELKRNSYLVMSPGRMGGDGMEVILDYLRMCFHIDIIKFNNMLRHLHKYENEVWELYRLMGEMDAWLAVAQYRAFLPRAVTPVFHMKDEVRMEKGYHPLVKDAVANSLTMKKNVLLTGSNASGKSTFLKTLGINVLLAQTIHTCAAEKFELPFSSLYTSMSLKDSLFLKESYYMAEIKAIKRILDAAQNGEKVICMVDEVLRGTNTLERISASTCILRTMAEQKVICVAATHDVELTKTLEIFYDNYHFEEAMEGADISFSYCLKEGKAESCNAIKLLKNIGYEERLIQEAEKMVEVFREQGEWICE